MTEKTVQDADERLEALSYYYGLTLTGEPMTEDEITGAFAAGAAYQRNRRPDEDTPPPAVATWLAKTRPCGSADNVGAIQLPLSEGAVLAWVCAERTLETFRTAAGLEVEHVFLQSGADLVHELSDKCIARLASEWEREMGSEDAASVDAEAELFV